MEKIIFFEKEIHNLEDNNKQIVNGINNLSEYNSINILLEKTKYYYQRINKNKENIQRLIKDIELSVEENKKKQNLGISGLVGSIFLTGFTIIGGIIGSGITTAKLATLKKENKELLRILDKAIFVYNDIEKLIKNLKELLKKVPQIPQFIQNDVKS